MTVTRLPEILGKDVTSSATDVKMQVFRMDSRSTRDITTSAVMNASDSHARRRIGAENIITTKIQWHTSSSRARRLEVRHRALGCMIATIAA
mmetsp:Transcript_131256/g.245618  ORF Transcript_131256/g.245618 Transcript_131256/m.245618 type:complete len:92 (+) Transcript_131256:82-357(+)